MRLRSMHAFPLRTKPAGLPLLLQTLMIIAGAFAAGGCGGQAPAPAPGPETNPDFLRLRLEARGHWRDLARTTRLTPTREDSGWDAQARFHQILTVPETVAPDLPLALYAYGPGTRMLKVPGPFDPATFDRITLTILSGQSVQLRLILRRDDQPVLASDELQVEASATLRELAFPMAMLHGLTEPFDDLLVRVIGPGHLALVAVELEHQPPEGWLPQPDAGPGPVVVAGESRPALGLGPEGTLTGRAPASEGAHFSFSWAVPRGVSSAPGTTLLRLSLTADGPTTGPATEAAPGTHLDLEFPLTSGHPWTAHEIPINGALAELGFTYTFDLDPTPGSPAGPEACALTPPNLIRPRPNPPTVVLITSDTHRADHLGLAGGGVQVSTPQLDALARRGLFFEDCYASTNVTNPSHVALLTGTHPRDTGIIDNTTSLAAAAPTLAEAFRSAGYTTAMAVSTTHLAPQYSGLGQGFDRVSFPLEAHRDGARTLAACDGWWEESAGQPLFLWLHLFDAHAPYEVPAEALAAYYPADRDPYSPDLEEPPSHQRPSWDREIRDVSHLDARYRAEITYLDGLVGELLARPRVAAGHLAFTADHGESLGAHDVFWDHRELYPDTLAVPLILAGPGVPVGQQRSVPLLQQDLGRTLLDLAGLTQVPFPGESLLPAPGDPGQAGPPSPRFALSANATSASVALNGYFLVLHLMEHTLHADLPRLPRHRVELYHLTVDPVCAVDLVESDPERARALRKLLIDWLQAPRSAGWATEIDILPTAHLENLAGLGYTEEQESTTNWFDGECECSWCSGFRQ